MQALLMHILVGKILFKKKKIEKSITKARDVIVVHVT